MDLLNQATRDAIRLAIMDVTDTFCKSEVVYHQRNATQDRWGNGTQLGYKKTTIFCFIEYPEIDINDGKFSTSGVSDPFDITLMLHTNKAIEAGLLTPPNKLLVQVGDIFLADGKYYEVEDFNTNGHFEAKSQIVLIKGIRIQEQQAFSALGFHNNTVFDNTHN